MLAVDAGSDQISVLAVSAFRVHDGSLTELPLSPTPLPAGAKPFEIVVS